MMGSAPAALGRHYVRGAGLGRIDLPPGRAPQQIGDDWILLAGEDDAGVAHVWLYNLIKP